MTDQPSEATIRSAIEDALNSFDFASTDADGATDPIYEAIKPFISQAGGVKSRGGAIRHGSRSHNVAQVRAGRLVQDGDCHWYFIPMDRMADFGAWKNAIEGDHKWRGTDYDAYRLDMHPSNYVFTMISEDA